MMKEPNITLFGNKQATRCQSKSKRSRVQCRNAAVRNTSNCRMHGSGGGGGGPKTAEGRQRCSEAKTIHGNETRAGRAAYCEGMRELYELEVLGREIGLIIGPKRAGRKPKS